MKNENTKKASDFDKSIEPLLKQIAKTPGARAAVHRQFCKLAKRQISRQAVDLWLHADRTKRPEPSYSNALRLFAAIKAVMDGDEVPT